ncbi:uncharacterized protein G2W53_042496 [Senna tora]|uniref:Uncharacterized protein n=1 Tax=Senna tora TaxID=362788 RepID=A0A834SIY5_9FABA|nr:uncharacterized protein G2W53_042496 [Senna tora]
MSSMQIVYNVVGFGEIEDWEGVAFGGTREGETLVPKKGLLDAFDVKGIEGEFSEERDEEDRDGGERE